MRNPTVLLAIALLTPAARAASVEMQRPHIKYMADVDAPCMAHKRGCTTVSTEFFCGCEQAGDAWKAHPHLIAQPVIYTTTDQVLRHELQHIADIRGALNAYAAAILLRTFETEGACTAFVDEEAKTFGHTMKLIYRDTTMRRDGVQIAGPIE
ncbi:MAG TPA: hypothetical protein VLV78_10110 [Thermoanaerobaculia bacterium]|nr:hypothetical protein [Thermoanaerobaculia bacterium]